MKLIYQEGIFYKVYCAKVGDYFVLFSSDYPCKRSLICTCETEQDAMQEAMNYVEQIAQGIAF